MTDCNNTIFLLEKKQYDDKRKKDVNKGFIALSGDTDKKDAIYQRDYIYQECIFYLYLDEEPEELNDTLNKSKNDYVVYINGKYYNRKGIVSIQKSTQISESRVRSMMDKSLKGLKKYVDNLEKITNIFENISTSNPIDYSVDVKTLLILQKNINSSKDNVLNDISKCVESYDQLCKSPKKNNDQQNDVEYEEEEEKEITPNDSEVENEESEEDEEEYPRKKNYPKDYEEEEYRPKKASPRRRVKDGDDDEYEQKKKSSPRKKYIVEEMKVPSPPRNPKKNISNSPKKVNAKKG